MTTHAKSPLGAPRASGASGGESLLKDYGLGIGAITLGVIAVVVGLFLSYLIGGLLGLVTWAAAGGARSVAQSNNRKGYALAIVAAVLGAIAILMLFVGNWLT